MKYKNYLQWLKIVLRILGLWPATMNSRLLEFFYSFYSLLILSLFCIIFNLSELINLFSIYNEFQAFAADLCWFVMHFSMCFKIILFLSKIKRVQNICERLKNGLSDDFHRTIEEKEEYNSRILGPAVTRSIRYLVVYYVLGAAVLLNGFIAPLYRDLPEVVEANNTKETGNITMQVKRQQLPYYTYVICDVETSPCYEMAYAYQTLSTLICSLVIIHCDNLYIIIVLLCCSEFKILNKSLESFNQRVETEVKRRFVGNEKKRGKTFSDEIDRESLKLGTNCVKHHHAILEVSEEIESIYSLVILPQFMSHLVQLCFQMFLITEVPAFSFDGISLIAFIIAMVIEVYVFCECSNEIEIESTRVSEAAYNAGWTSSSEPVKKTLLLMMLRAQRPVQFTVGKFVKLSLRTLVSVLQGSFSYFMVLREIK